MNVVYFINVLDNIKKDVLKRGGANSNVSLCLLVYGYLWETAPSFLFNKVHTGKFV